MIRRDRIKDIRANELDKVAESKKKSKVYTTKIIDEILRDIKKGKDPDTKPFWHGKLDYKDSGIIFELTDEEKAEMQKCDDDCLYFVSNYCKFKNDHGYTTVLLRAYQTDILHMLGDETYNEEIDEIVPANRRVILMCSRQTGKCLSLDSEIFIKDNCINKKKYNIFYYLWKKIYKLLKKLSVKIVGKNLKNIEM